MPRRVCGVYDTKYMRAMWITFLVCSLMMLAMDSNPLLGIHTSSEPQPETHHVGEHRMELNTSMTLTTM